MALLPDSGMTIVEAPARDQPIAVSSSPVAVFLGRCLSGPVNTPIVIEGVAAFERWFGGHWNESSLPEQVAMFFQHGGKRALVVRVANNATGGLLNLPTDGDPITLRLVNPGSGERVRASVDYDDLDDSDLFNLTVQRTDRSGRHILDQEIHRALSVAPDAEDYFVHRLNDSALVRAERAGLPSGLRPIASQSTRVGRSVSYVEMVQSGDDGDPLADYDLIGSDKSATGLFALDIVAQFDFLYACTIDGLSTTGAAFVFAAERYCRMHNATLLLDPPYDCQDADQMLAWRRHHTLDSANVLSYFPPVASRQDVKRRVRSPAGALAGLLCKQDVEHHVFNALADNVRQNSAALHRDWVAAYALTADEAISLLNAGVNPVIDGSQRRLLFPGLVTTANRRDRNLGSLPDQRLCRFILRSIEHGTRWAVFEPVGEPVWQRVTAQVSEFMEALNARGAFEKSTGLRGWSVRCDETINAGHGQLRLLLAFRPAGSHAPYMFTVTQDADGTSACRTAFEYSQN